MEPAKIIARFRDGDMAKGYSRNFFPNKPSFHISEDGSMASSDAEELFVEDLKAVFFVKEFKGDPEYNERKVYEEGERSQGRKVEIQFEDGEKMQGSVLGYNANQQGFFLFPVDRNSNNDRAFIVNDAVKEFKYL
jgi:hypothetical protein